MPQINTPVEPIEYNVEDVKALEEFARHYPEQSLTEEIPAEADLGLNIHTERVLHNIGYSGVICYDWNLIRPALARKLLWSFRSNEHRKKRQDIVQLLVRMQGAPFTLQRLCEIALNPEYHYRSDAKRFNAIEVLCRVTSTIPPLSPEEYHNTIIDLQKTMQAELEQKEKMKDSVKQESAHIASDDMALDSHGIDTDIGIEIATIRPPKKAEEEPTAMDLD